MMNKLPGKILALCLVAVLASSCARTPAVRTDRSVEAPEDFGGVYHVMEKGMTLWRVARAYGVDLETLQWVNAIEDVTDIRIGKKIFIPGAQKVLQVEPYRPGEVVTPEAAEAVVIIWPLVADPSSRYGPRGRRKHEGIDLPARKGTPISAAADGRVVYSGRGMKGYGKVIVVKHNDDISTVYAHNSANMVRMGDRVRQGQVIARVGSTGRATGPHLHFEIRRRGIAEDPLGYLPEL